MLSVARSSPLLRRKALAQLGRKGKSRLQLDALFRAVILTRDGFHCRRCGNGKRPGRGGGLQAAHIKPVGTHPSMRFVVENALCLCASCHIFGKGAWHKGPSPEWAELLQKHVGQETLDNLELWARTRSGQKIDKEATRIYLEGELAHYRGLRECVDG